MPLFKKKFKDTKAGIWLKEKAPDLLKEVGHYLPDKGGLGIIKNIIGKSDKLTPEDKELALDIIKHELEADKEITKRWESDMNSDSWLSKNARPMVLLYGWALITILCIFSFFNILIPAEYTGLIKELTIIVNVAYFGLRTLEKRK